jgi:3-hydroxybutyryl-CoA dehydrogenase
MSDEPGPTLPYDSIAVLGAGTMGAGIALAAIRAGLDVTLVDVSSEALDRASARIDDNLARHAPAAADPRPGLLSISTVIEEAITGAGAVIEAVPELPALKHQIFARLAAAPAGILLVSNTSTISIGELADACDGSAAVVGMHFFNPAHRMPLVEVIVADSTSAAARDGAIALARALGKQPVVVRDVPGFVTSRLGLLLGTEAMRMVEEGVASPADIDTAMKLGYRHPMGPLELADLVGLDARLNNLRSIRASSGTPAYDPPGVLVDLVERGQLGRKSGRGFFVYDEAGAIVQDVVS